MKSQKRGTKMTEVRKLKSILAISVVAFGALCSAAMGRDLRIATEGTYAPWSYVDEQGKLTGWDVDIANALCEQMKVKCEVIAQEWDGIIPGLNAKKYDLIVASMSVNEKRKQQVAFTKKYKNSTSQFIAAKGTFSDTSPVALAGKRIGVQRGSSQDAYLTANYPNSEIVRYDKTSDPEMDLVAGRVDLFLANRVTELSGFLTRPENKDFGLVGQEYSGGPLGDGNAIALRKDDTVLLQQVNDALDAIMANGTYDKITAKYFKFKLM
jgi:arginine/ornithine transport system substrate-binding protein